MFFVDDNLIGNRRAAREDLLPALSRWQKQHGRLGYLTQVSIDLADDGKLTAAMVEAGFDIVFIGIETPVADSLAECSKRQNQNRDLVADVKKLQRAGLDVQGGFIVGFDGDTPQTLQRLVDFIQESGIATAMVGILQASPGTRLYERMGLAGRLVGHSSGNNSDGTTNIQPVMGLEALKDGYVQLLRQIYSPRLFYQRVRHFLREYRSSRSRPVNIGVLGIFLRTLHRLGIVARERGQFWRLLAWTLLRQPTKIAAAMRLAIFGHHYMRLSAAGLPEHVDMPEY